MKKSWKTYAFWIAAAEAVGGITALATRKGMKEYMLSARKPPLSPPPVVFPIVWTVLYALMGIGAARVSLTPPSPERSRALQTFRLQLAAGALWTLLFFGLHAYGLAFLWIIVLWLLILKMIVDFNRVDRPAAYLQLPYLIWTTFAAFLNFGTWFLNR